MKTNRIVRATQYGLLGTGTALLLALSQASVAQSVRYSPPEPVRLAQATPARTAAATPAKIARAQTLVAFLETQGLKGEIDEDADVKFRYEGGTYYFLIDTRDQQFFRLLFANFWKIESEAERERVRVAVDMSNQKSKVAKLYVARDNVSAAAELLFLDADRDFKPLFRRTISVLQNGVFAFRDQMRTASAGR